MVFVYYELQLPLTMAHDRRPKMKQTVSKKGDFGHSLLSQTRRTPCMETASFRPDRLKILSGFVVCGSFDDICPLR